MFRLVLIFLSIWLLLFTERMRLSFRFVHISSAHSTLLFAGTPLVRRSNCVVHDTRQFTSNGVRVCSPRWQATIFGRSRTAGHTHHDIRTMWPVRVYHWLFEKYTDACALWCLSVHGYFVAEGLTGMHAYMYNQYSWSLEEPSALKPWTSFADECYQASANRIANAFTCRHFSTQWMFFFPSVADVRSNNDFLHAGQVPARFVRPTFSLLYWLRFCQITCSYGRCQ